LIKGNEQAEPLQSFRHCFPEIIEKVDGKIVAQCKATLWRDDYQNINRNFLRILLEPLKDGIKILFLAKILIPL
jgi:exodeoxyribonuclease VII large subunit